MAHSTSPSTSSSIPQSSEYSSLFRNPPMTVTPPTTHGKSVTSKTKLSVSKHIPQLFRATSQTSPPVSPTEFPPPDRRASTVTRRLSHLRRISFSKSAPRPPLTAQIPECSSKKPHSDVHHRLMKHESRCLQYISSGISVAFEDDARSFGVRVTDEELRTEDGRRFSHIIQISRTKDFFSPSTISYSTDRHLTKHLHLSTLPLPHDQYEQQMQVLSLDPELTRITAEQADIYLDSSYFSPEKRFTLADNGVAKLGSRQLAAAKEFIRSSGTGVITTQTTHPGRTLPQILVTAPRDHRTDIMSVVACFLASTSDSSPAEVVKSIDRQRGVKRIWQGCISRVGVEYIQGVC
ncbi:hypothetical protein L218DRAFT_390504 [Marasmius fiardii PR-910]|nr:hypothetical protein L218DRAFT_390504 [Marasmius fiardii PR-910]